MLRQFLQMRAVPSNINLTNMLKQRTKHYLFAECGTPREHKEAAHLATVY